MAKNEKKAEELKCPKCGSDDFAIAEDGSKKHYCSKCQHVWVPGVNIAGRPDLLMQSLKKENEELKTEIGRERAENKALREQIALLKGDEPEAAEGPAGDIFS